MDIIMVFSGILMALSKPMAMVCLFLMGLRFWQGSGYAKHLVFCLLFLNLAPLVQLMESWLPGTAVYVPSDALGLPWVRDFVSGIKTLIETYLMRWVAPSMAVFFVVQAFIYMMQGDTPMRPLIGALFMMSLVGTSTMLTNMGSGAPESFFSSWRNLATYTAMRICPVTAGISMMAAIINYALHRGFLSYLWASLGLLTIPGTMKLMTRFVTTGF